MLRGGQAMITAPVTLGGSLGQTGLGGSVYFYEQQLGTWQEQQRIVWSPASSRSFGEGLDWKGSRLAVTSKLTGSPTLMHAVLFEHADDQWTEAWSVAGDVNADGSYTSVIALAEDQVALVVEESVTSLISEVQVYGTVPSAVSYCTAKLNSLGCQPSAMADGVAQFGSSAAFDVIATQVLNRRNGLLFYGTAGRVELPFFEGLLCVSPPLRRTGFQHSFGSAPPVQDCSGTYSFDFNAYLDSGVDGFLKAGQTVNAQYWSRDPSQTDGTGVGLTDAVEFVVCP